VIAIVNEFKENGPEILKIGKDIVLGIWEGIKSLVGWLEEKIGDFVGGIVDNVKGVLGIHSPSRVFAGIGKNMALGIGAGWDSEYNGIRQGITSGLDFGTAKVGFAESSLGMASAGMVNAGAKSGFSVPQTVELRLTSADGQTFGRWMVPFIRSEDKSNPEVVSDSL
jgi:phage-related protein